MILNQAVILCGGRGERLNHLTKITPKPLLKINGVPFIEYLIKNLSRQGIREIILLCGYLSEKFESKYHKKNFFGVKLFCIKENKPLGTGGAIINAYKKLENYTLAIETLKTLISRESLSEPMKKIAEKELAKLSNTTDVSLATTPNQENLKSQEKELTKHSNKTDSSSATSPVEAENSKASENEKDSIELDKSPVLNPKPTIINI